MSGLMKCGQAGCEQQAAYKFTWPGKDEAAICMEHERKLSGVAAAMGLHLQVIPLPLEPTDDEPAR